MTKNKKSVAIARTAMVVLVVVILGWAINLLFLSPRLHEPARATIRVLSSEADAVLDEGHVAIPASRSPVAIGDMCEVVVHNDKGDLLRSLVEGGGAKYLLEGAGWLPSNLGSVTVSSVGYASAAVLIQGKKVDVLLQRAFSIMGKIFDASSGKPLVRMHLLLEERSSGRRLMCDTDIDGAFEIKDIPEGEYVMKGEMVGYVPLCDGGGALAEGVAVSVHGDLRVDVPAFPVYVALCGLVNATNLSNDVFESLIICNFGVQPGDNLPQWMSRDYSDVILKAAKAKGVAHAYGQACMLTSLLGSRDGEVRFVMRGTGVRTEARVQFQSIADFEDSSELSLITIDRQLEVGPLTVESPVILRICPKVGLAFGGLKTKPGHVTFLLPYGKYLIRPLDENPLLNRQWSKEVAIPEDSKITISPSEGFATLQLEGGSEWPHGYLSCAGSGFTMGMPLKSLPISMPVSPGRHSFVAYSDRGETVVWRGEVSVAGGDAVKLVVSR